MISTHVYNELRQKFTPETADALISHLESKPATKEDVDNAIRDLRTDLRGFIQMCTWLIGILISLAVVIIKFV